MSLAEWLDDLDAELQAAAGRRRGARLSPRTAATAAAALLAVTAAAAVGLRGDEAERPATPPPPVVRAVAPAEILGEPEPYMGVACSEPNRIGCDRIGLAVWLREPARAVTADIGGRAFALDDDESSGHSEGRHRSSFVGFLQPAGLVAGDGPLRIPSAPDGRWLGGDPVSAPVTLTITLAAGDVVRTTVEVALAAGWG